MSAPADADRRSVSPLRLVRYLALAYAALIVYASLHPFSGWRDGNLTPSSFLEAGWPRYWTGFDIAANLLAYLPLGLLLALALRSGSEKRMPALPAALLAAGIGTALSFCMESVQTWLPTRVPSSLDLLCNSAGAALGALLAVVGGGRLLTFIRRCQRWLAPIHDADIILVLVGFWLLAQLSPETLLFGAGNLRVLLDIPSPVDYDPSAFFAIETAIIACNMTAVGLIVRFLLAPQHRILAPLITFFALAMIVRALATAILVEPAQAIVWLTPGAALGTMIGGALLSLLLLLPPRWQQALAALFLMTGAVLINLAPPNPYSQAAMAVWQQGHFLNFNGLTRLIASLWPFLALPCLTFLRRPRHFN